MRTGGIVWLGAMAYVRTRILDSVRVLCIDLRRLEVDTGDSIAKGRNRNANDFSRPEVSLLFGPAWLKGLAEKRPAYRCDVAGKWGPKGSRRTSNSKV